MVRGDGNWKQRRTHRTLQPRRDFFKAMAQARVDNSTDRTFRSFLSPDLLILDDLGLHGLTAQRSAYLYELILTRHRGSSFVITRNWGRGRMTGSL